MPLIQWNFTPEEAEADVNMWLMSLNFNLHPEYYITGWGGEYVEARDDLSTQDLFKLMNKKD